MTPLVALIAIVLVAVIVGNLIGRARAGRQSVRSHHRALDTLGHISTQRPEHVDQTTGPAVSSRQAHVRVVPAEAERSPDGEAPDGLGEDGTAIDEAHLLADLHDEERRVAAADDRRDTHDGDASVLDETVLDASVLDETGPTERAVDPDPASAVADRHGGPGGSEGATGADRAGDGDGDGIDGDGDQLAGGGWHPARAEEEDAPVSSGPDEAFPGEAFQSEAFHDEAFHDEAFQDDDAVALAWHDGEAPVNARGTDYVEFEGDDAVTAEVPVVVDDGLEWAGALEADAAPTGRQGRVVADVEGHPYRFAATVAPGGGDPTPDGPARADDTVWSGAFDPASRAADAPASDASASRATNAPASEAPASDAPGPTAFGRGPAATDDTVLSPVNRRAIPPEVGAPPAGAGDQVGASVTGDDVAPVEIGATAWSDGLEAADLQVSQPGETSDLQAARPSTSVEIRPGRSNGPGPARTDLAALAAGAGGRRGRPTRRGSGRATTGRSSGRGGSGRSSSGRRASGRSSSGRQGSGRQGSLRPGSPGLRSSRSHRRRRSRRPAAVALMAFVVVGAVAAAVLVLDHRHHAKPTASPKTPTSVTTSRTTPPTPTPTTSLPVKLISSGAGTSIYKLAGFAQITVKANGPCWIEIRRANVNGPLIYSQTMAAGATESVSGPAWLRLGNPTAVAISVGGAPVSPPVVSGQPYDLQFQ